MLMTLILVLLFAHGQWVTSSTFVAYDTLQYVHTTSHHILLTTGKLTSPSGARPI